MLLKVKKVFAEMKDKKPTKADMTRLITSINKKLGAHENDQVITLGFPKGRISESLIRIPTGSFSLDLALGGGIPAGRFTEISGAYSSTKTTQCLHIIRNAQSMGMTCAYIDIEGTIDENFAKAIGVDVDSLFYSKPDSAEEATQLILDLQKSGKVQLAVLDSIAALAPNKEQRKEMEDTMQMGVLQNILSEFFRKYQANNNRLDREDCIGFTLIGVNQLREKIGAYGDPEYTPGGRAKGFTASVDIRLRRGDWINEGTGADKEVVGQVVKFKVEKNKTYKRMQTGECDFYFSDNNSAGVQKFYNDNIKEVILNAVAFGVINRRASYFDYDGNTYQGVLKLTDALRNDEELIKKLKKEILNLAGAKNV